MVGVRIPIVDQSVGLTSQGVEGGPNPRMTAVPVSNAMGEALQQFAHAGAQYNRLLEHQADQDARAWVTNALPDVSLKAQSLLQQNKESAKEGAAGGAVPFTCC